ncbi:MAG TPA: radical SAM protein [Syntrophorhabdaceae bacterium]|nr:radical SAM protein [Syntrophorhabdaceae bacterium]
MIVPVFLPHLGCHTRCTYCNQQLITDVKDTDLGTVIGKTLNAHQGPYEVGLFAGNIFGIEPDQLRRLFAHFEGYRERIANFRVSTKPVSMRNETLEILKANRVTVIELGIPTFNDKVLSRLNRRHSAQDLISSYETLVKQGFRVALQFMVGLPGETMDDIRLTVQNMTGLKPHYIRIYPLVVFEGTRLGEMYKKGRFKPISFDAALDRSVFIYLNAKKSEIPVVKMGLTENEVIKEQILAGQYHPAYGYMVKARAFYLAMMAKLVAVPIKGSAMTVHLSAADVAHLTGYKRTNVDRFEKEGIALQWEEKEVPEDNFILHYDGRSVPGNVLDAMEMFRD